MKSKVKVNYYRVLYMTKNQELIDYFWRWYNTHKVKSKQRAARNVLLHYYSTTPAPAFVLNAFTLKRDIKISKENLWSELL